MTLGVRLLLLILVSLLPAVVIQIVNEVELRREREAEVRELAMRRAELAAAELGQVIDGVANVLTAVARVPAVEALRPLGCTGYLSDLVPQVPQLATIAVIEPAGRLVCNGGDAPVELDKAGRAYVVQAAQARGHVVGSFTRPSGGGPPYLPVAQPMRDGADRLVGIIVGHLDLAWLGRQLAQRPRAGSGSLTIADADGTILAREPSPERFVGTRIPPMFEHLVRAEGAGALELTSQDGTRRIVGYVPVGRSPSGLYVSAGLGTEEAFGLIEQATRRELALFASGVLLALVAAWFGARLFVRQPVEILVRAAARWRAGDYAARTGLAGRGEIASLGAAFDRMADEIGQREAEREKTMQALRESEQRLRVVALELNHRVKNTLASVRTIVMRSLQPDRRSLAEARDVLAERLLALSNAHDLLTAGNWEGVGLHDLIAGELKPYGERATVRGLPIVLSPRAAQAMVLLLHELATNAAKYGALSTTEGQVEISWEFLRHAGDEALQLTWSEHGGPAVEPPSRSGFGRMLLERVVSHELQGEAIIDYRPGGFFYRATLPRRAVEAVPLGADAMAA